MYDVGLGGGARQGNRPGLGSLQILRAHAPGPPLGEVLGQQRPGLEEEERPAGLRVVQTCTFVRPSLFFFKRALGPRLVFQLPIEYRRSNGTQIRSK